jgi:hypothetical protein
MQEEHMFIIDLIRKTFTPGAKLTLGERRTTILCGIVAALALLLLVIIAAGRAAAIQTGAESPAWETALQARVILGRLVASLGVWVVAIGTALLTYQLLDNSRLGRWLTHWDVDEGGFLTDPPNVAAAKTLGGALILAAMLMSAGALFGSVLR